MQKEIKILQGQNIADIAIQEFGKLEGLASIASVNDIGLTEVLETSDVLMIETSEISGQLLRQIKNDNLIPASNGDIIAATSVLPGGIGYMGIGIDFMVN